MTFTRLSWFVFSLILLLFVVCFETKAFVAPTFATKKTALTLLQKKEPARHFYKKRTSSPGLFGSFEDKEKSDEECSVENLDACITEYLKDEECSIDNLDACAEPTCHLYKKRRSSPPLFGWFENREKFDEECSIDNLDACTPKYVKDEEQEPYSIDNLKDDEKQGGDSEQFLRKFLSLPVVELQLAVLVLLSSFLVGLGTLQSIPPILATIAQYGELIISTVFTLEYLARWKLNNFSLKYIVTPLALIDLVAILPFFIKILLMLGVIVPAGLTGGALINLRLLRILRLQRVLIDYETFQKFEMSLGKDPSDTRPYQLQLARVVISIFTLLSVTSGLIYSAEHTVNPDVPDYFTALYFSLTTLTTVGFGDIHPVTNAGRWVVSGSILIGSAVIPAQAAALVEALLDRQEDQKKTTNSNKEKDSEKSDGDEANDSSPRLEEIDAVSEAAVVARMERLEQKLDETNARIDRVLSILETKAETGQRQP